MSVDPHLRTCSIERGHKMISIEEMRELSLSVCYFGRGKVVDEEVRHN